MSGWKSFLKGDFWPRNVFYIDLSKCFTCKEVFVLAVNLKFVFLSSSFSLSLSLSAVDQKVVWPRYRNICIGRSSYKWILHTFCTSNAIFQGMKGKWRTMLSTSTGPFLFCLRNAAEHMYWDEKNRTAVLFWTPLSILKNQG